MGERLFLRHPTIGDCKEFIDLTQKSQPLHTPWVAPPRSRGEFLKYLSIATSSAFKGVLLCRNSDGRILGVYNLSQIVYGKFKNAYLGFYVSALYAKQGYMSEGMHLIIDLAFNTLKLHRLEANVQPDNIASLRLLKRCGFQKEGYSPKYLKIGRRWRDHERWAIRKDIWHPPV